MTQCLRVILGGSVSSEAPAGQMRVTVMIDSEQVIDATARPDLALSLAIHVMQVLHPEAKARTP